MPRPSHYSIAKCRYTPYLMVACMSWLQLLTVSLVACLTCIGRCRGNWLGFPDRFFFSEVRSVLCSSIYHRLNSRSAIVVNLLNSQSLSRTLINFIPCSLNAESTFLPNLVLIWYFNSAFKAVCLFSLHHWATVRRLTGVPGGFASS